MASAAAAKCCAVCGKQGCKSKCGKCKIDYYCSHGCQAEAWASGHNSACPGDDPDARAEYLAAKAVPIAAAAETFASMPLPETCDNCGRGGGKLKLCARCQEQRYCSTDCQKAAWTSGHREVCGKIVADRAAHLDNLSGSLKTISDIRDLFEAHKKKQQWSEMWSEYWPNPSNSPQAGLSSADYAGTLRVEKCVSAYTPMHAVDNVHYYSWVLRNSSETAEDIARRRNTIARMREIRGGPMSSLLEFSYNAPIAPPLDNRMPYFEHLGSLKFDASRCSLVATAAIPAHAHITGFNLDAAMLLTRDKDNKHLNHKDEWLRTVYCRPGPDFFQKTPCIMYDSMLVPHANTVFAVRDQERRRTVDIFAYSSIFDPNNIDPEFMGSAATDPDGQNVLRNIKWVDPADNTVHAVPNILFMGKFLRDCGMDELTKLVEAQAKTPAAMGPIQHPTMGSVLVPKHVMDNIPAYSGNADDAFFVIEAIPTRGIYQMEILTDEKLLGMCVSYNNYAWKRANCMVMWHDSGFPSLYSIKKISANEPLCFARGFTHWFKTTLMREDVKFMPNMNTVISMLERCNVAFESERKSEYESMRKIQQSHLDLNYGHQGVGICVCSLCRQIMQEAKKKAAASAKK